MSRAYYFSQTNQFLTLKTFAPLKSQCSNTAEIANKQNTQLPCYILKKKNLSNILLHQTWKIDLWYHRNDGFSLGNNLCRFQSFLLTISFSKEEEIDYFGCKICLLREVLINPAKQEVVYWKSMKALSQLETWGWDLFSISLLCWMDSLNGLPDP